MKFLFRLILGVLLVIVLAGGAVYVAAQQKPSVAQGLKPVQSSTTAAQSFDSKVETMNKAVNEAKRPGMAQAVEVSFTEEKLTSKAAEAAQGTTQGMTAQDTQIHLSGSQIIATSTLAVSRVSVNLGVVAEPIVVNGQMRIVVKEIQTGALPIPDAIRQQINAQIGNAIDPSKLGLPIDVSQLTVVDGKLVIKGTARP